MRELIYIQQELKAPKNQVNRYGGYNYRSAEDILEAVKPICAKNNCYVVLNDELVVIEGWHYIKSTVTIKNLAGESETATSFAREEEQKKGMDASQITGSAASYARKRALGNLFALDDTKDADATNTHGKDAPTPTATKSPVDNRATTPAPAVTAQPMQPAQPAPAQPAPQPQQYDLSSIDGAILYINSATSVDDLMAKSKQCAVYFGNPTFIKAGQKKKKELTA